MNDTKCERCEQLKACTDHPEALVGSRWQPAGSCETVRVVGVFPGHIGLLGLWYVVYETDDSPGVLSLSTLDAWVRLPEPPAAMPTMTEEHWVSVHADGWFSRVHPSREGAIHAALHGWLGVVQLAPVSSSWQPAERSKP